MLKKVVCLPKALFPPLIETLKSSFSPTLGKIKFINTLWGKWNESQLNLLKCFNIAVKILSCFMILWKVRDDVSAGKRIQGILCLEDIGLDRSSTNVLGPDTGQMNYRPYLGIEKTEH